MVFEFFLYLSCKSKILYYIAFKSNEMKQILYLLLIALFISSCSSNSESDSSIDPIIGSWKLKSISSDGIEESDECTRKTTIKFLENGTSDAINYDYEGVNDCRAYPVSGIWENVGDSNYEFTSQYENSTYKIIFTNNNNVFTYSDTEEYNGSFYITTIVFERE